MIGGGLTHIDTFDPKDGNGPGSPLKNKAGEQFTEYVPEIAKVAAAGDGETLQKLDTIAETVKALLKASEAQTAENTALKKRLEAIEAQPAPAKGALKVVAVEKAQDTGGDVAPTPVQQFEKALADKDPLAAMKITHAYAAQPVIARG